MAAGGAAPDDPAAFEAELADVHAECAALLPGAAVPLERFAEALGRAGASPGTLRSACVSDVFLATACRWGDRRALAHFDATLLAELPRFVGRFRLSVAALEDLRQDLRAKLFTGAEPKIAQYEGRRPLGAWLRVVALREAIDRGRRGGEALREPPGELAAAGNVELEYLRRRYEGAFGEAVRDAVASLDGPTRTLLRMHFVDGVGIDGLAALHQVHRSSAHRRLTKAKTELQRRTQELLRERLGLEQGELDSLARVVDRDLELSIRTLFRTRV